jgi:hypothetical protein
LACAGYLPQKTNINEITFTGASAQYVEVKTLSEIDFSGWKICYVADNVNPDQCVEFGVDGFTLYPPYPDGTILTASNLLQQEGNYIVHHFVPPDPNSTYGELVLMDNQNPPRVVDYLKYCKDLRSKKCKSYWSVPVACGNTIQHDQTNEKGLARKLPDGTGNWTESPDQTEGYSNDGLTAAIDHYVIAHDGFGIHCLGEALIVEARDSSNNPVVAGGETITINTGTGKGTWTLQGGSGTPANFSDATANDGIATYTFSSGETSVGFLLSYQEGSSPINISVTDGTVSDDGSEGTLPFYPNGFVVTESGVIDPTVLDTTISTKTAGTDFILHLTAYGQTPTDPTCGIIESYTGVKNLRFWASYDDPAYTTDAPRKITANGNGIDKVEDETVTNHAVTFTAGKASIITNYKDVGRIGINLKDITITDPVELPNGIRGASSLFVVKPADFTIANVLLPSTPGDCSAGTSLLNPTPVSEGATTKAQAGVPFCATVTAIDAEGDATPSFGKESAPEDVLLAPAIVAAGGTNNPDITVHAADTFSGGSTTPQISWGEVGIITLAGRIGDGDYLGAGDVTGSPSANIGRFTPFDFDVTGNTPDFVPGCGIFTYLGQGFDYNTAPQVTITARNAAGDTTVNYDNTWWKLDDFSESYSHNGVISAGAALDSSAAGHGAIACTNCGGSVVVNFNGPFNYTRSLMEVVPFDGAVDISFSVIDNDGIAYAANPFTISAIGFNGGNSEQRSGRAYAQDVHGTMSQTGEALAMPIGARYFDAAGVWSINSADSCSQYGYLKTDTGITTTSLPASPVILAGGHGDLTLTITGDDATAGGVSAITTNWPAWLQYNIDDVDQGSDGNLFDDNPSATATFGIFRGDDRFIYWREQP